MFKFLSIQYKLGAVDKDKLKSFVPKWITEIDYATITGDTYTA